MPTQHLGTIPRYGAEVGLYEALTRQAAAQRGQRAELGLRREALGAETKRLGQEELRNQGMNLAFALTSAPPDLKQSIIAAIKANPIAQEALNLVFPGVGVESIAQLPPGSLGGGGAKAGAAPKLAPREIFATTPGGSVVKIDLNSGAVEAMELKPETPAPTEFIYNPVSGGVYKAGPVDEKTGKPTQGLLLYQYQQGPQGQATFTRAGLEPGEEGVAGEREAGAEEPAPPGLLDSVLEGTKPPVGTTAFTPKGIGSVYQHLPGVGQGLGGVVRGAGEAGSGLLSAVLPPEVNIPGLGTQLIGSAPEEIARVIAGTGEGSLDWALRQIYRGLVGGEAEREEALGGLKRLQDAYELRQRPKYGVPTAPPLPRRKASRYPGFPTQEWAWGR